MAFYNTSLYIHIGIGLLLGVGFVLPWLWWCGLIGVVAQLYVLRTRLSDVRVYHVVLAWTIKYLFALGWFFSVYPLDWLGISLGSSELGVIALYWLTASLWLGLGGVVLLLGYKLCYRYFQAPILFALPVLWLIAELFGAYIFSLITYGPGATIGSQFSFGFSGYLAANHNVLIQFAQLHGVYGLTVLYVMIGVCTYWLIDTQRYYVIVTASIVLGLAHFVAVPSGDVEELDKESVHTVAVVTAHIDPSVWNTVVGRTERQRSLFSAYQAAKKTGADYVILPEDSRVVPQSSGTAAVRNFFSNTATVTDPIIIDSSRVVQSGSVYLQSISYNPKTTTAHYAAKQYLVPQGEYVPSLYAKAMEVFGLTDAVRYLKENIIYESGPATIPNRETVKPPILFCFESVDPKAVARLAKQQPDDYPFVAHVVSHGWFTGADTLQPQLNNMLRVQAIWNQTYIVSAANQTISYTYTPRGAIVTPHTVTQGDRWSVGLVYVPKN